MCSRSGAGIISGLYVIIIVESATVGMVLNESFEALAEYFHSKPEQRDATGVLLLTLIVIAITGHVLTIPWLCYGTQTHSASALIPYLAWRMLLSCLTFGVVIWQWVTNSSIDNDFTTEFQSRMVPMAAVEIVIGLVFFSIAIRAHSHFMKRKMRQETHNNNVENCANVFY